MKIYFKIYEIKSIYYYEKMQMIKSYFRNPTFIVVAETISMSLLQFLVYTALIKKVGSEEVGFWVLINTLLAFSRAADFWSQGLSSFLGQARGMGDTKLASSYAVTASAAGAVGYLGVALLGYASIWLFAGHLVAANRVETLHTALPLMVLTFWLTCMGGALMLAFLGFERPGLKALLNIGGTLLFLLLILSITPKLGLWGLLAAQAIQSAVVLLVGFCIWYFIIVRPNRGCFQGELLREMTGYGSKALALGPFQLAIEPLIRLIANSFGGLVAVAHVELAARLVAALRAVILAPGQLLVPTFARLSAKVDHVAQLLRDAENRFRLLGVVGFSTLLSAGPLLSTVILGSLKWDFLIMLWCLSLGWFANLLSAPAYFLCVGRRNLRPLLYTHIIMLFTVLIFGWIGGTVASLGGALLGVAIGLIIASIYQWQAAACEHQLVGPVVIIYNHIIVFLAPAFGYIILFLAYKFLSFQITHWFFIALDILIISFSFFILISIIPVKTFIRLLFKWESPKTPRQRLPDLIQCD